MRQFIFLISSIHKIVTVVVLVGILLFSIGGFFIFPFKDVNAAQTTCDWTGSGDGTSWDDKNNWSCGVIPNGNQYDVTICNASATAAVSVTATSTLTLGQLEVGDVNGGGCNSQTHTLTLHTDVILDDAQAFANAGRLVVGTNGVLSAGGYTITLDGSFDADATGAVFNEGTSTVHLLKTASILVGTDTSEFYNLTVGDSATETTIENPISVKVYNNFTVNNGLIDAGNGGVQLLKNGGSPLVLNGTADLSEADIKFGDSNTSSGYSIPGAVYYQFSLQGDGTATSTLTASSTFADPNTGSITLIGHDLDTNGYDVTILGSQANVLAGTLILSSSTVLTMHGDFNGANNSLYPGLKVLNGNTIYLPKDFKLYGHSNYDFGTSTVVVNGATNQTITTNGNSFYNLTVNKTVSDGSDDYIFADAHIVTNDFTLEEGDVDTKVKNFTVGNDFILKGSGDDDFFEARGSIIDIGRDLKWVGSSELASFRAGSSTISVARDVTFGVSSSDYARNTETLKLTGTGNLNFSAVGFEVFYNLHVATSSATTTVIGLSVGDIQIFNQLVVGGGVFTADADDRNLDIVKGGEDVPLVRFYDGGDLTAFPHLVRFGSALASEEMYIPGGAYNDVLFKHVNLGDSSKYMVLTGDFTANNLNIGDSNGARVLTDGNDLTSLYGTTTIENLSRLDVTGDSQVSVHSLYMKNVDSNSTFEVFNGNQVTVTGNWHMGTSTNVRFTAGTSTVVFAGTTTQNIIFTGDGNDEFYNLTINNSGSAGDDVVHVRDTIDVDNNLVLTDGVFDFSASSSALYIGGDFTVNANGAIAHNSTPITFDGTTTFTDNAGNFNLGQIIVASSTSAATFTLGSSATSSGVTVATGETFNLGGSGYTLTLAPDADGTGSSTPLTVHGTFTPGTSTVHYKATSTTPVTTAAATYSSLIVDAGGGSVTYNLGGTTDVNGGLTIQNGATLSSNGSNITLAGDFTNNATFNAGSDMVTLDGAGTDQNITSGGSSFYNLVLNNTASSGNDDIILQDALDVDNNFTLTDGDFNQGVHSVTIGGNLTMGANSSWTRASRTLIFDGTTTYIDNTGSFDLGELTVASSTATASFTLGSSATSSGIVVSVGETLNLGSSGYTLYLTDATASGTPLTVNGTLIAGTSNVVYKATSTDTTIASTTYSALTFDNMGGGATFTVQGGSTSDLTIASGTVVTTGALNLSGTFTNNGFLSQTTGYLAASSSLSFDAASYGNGDTITLTLTDPNRNISATSTDSATTTLTIGSDSETVTLTETGNSTGVFTGTITASDASATAGNNTLEADASGTITANYADIYDVTDTTTNTASMSASSGASSGSGSGGGGGGGILGFFGSIFGGGSDEEETSSEPATDEQTPDAEDPVSETDQTAKPPVSDSVLDFFDPVIPGILKPKPAPETKPSAELPSPEDFLASLPECNVYNCGWTLIPEKEVNQYVFAPLPENLMVLTQKFPELGQTFNEIGVTRLEDIDKLEGTTFTLPGLKDIAEIPDEVVFAALVPEGGGLTGPNLPAQGFNQIANLIDFNLALDIDKFGNVTQRINVVSGKRVNLVVKPEHPAKKITGYLVLAEGGLLSDEADTYAGTSQLASLLLSQKPVSREVEAPPEIEERLLLSKFEYTDANNDGIYEADVDAPLVHGEYEVLTIVEYEDETYGTKEIRFVLVVDPEGYVYEEAGGREIRLPDVGVSIYWKNPDTGEFVLWPADEYQQRNPQTTNVTGEYSFLVPPGEYYLVAEADGYHKFESEVFPVREGRGVHMNIEMEAEESLINKLLSPWLLVAVMFVILSTLIGYNFYKDRNRNV